MIERSGSVAGLDFEIEFRVRRRVGKNVEPEERLLMWIAGAIAGKDVWGGMHDLGKVRLCRVLAGRALDEGDPIGDVFDSSADLSAYFEALYEPSGVVRESVEEVLGDSLGGMDLLIVDEVWIRPPYRGHFLGLRVIDEAEAMFGGGCNIVATMVAPMQFLISSDDSEEAAQRADYSLDSFTINIDEAHQRLGRYISTLGFKQVKSDSNVWAYSTVMRRTKPWDGAH